MIQHRSPVSGIAAFGDSYVLTAGYDNQVILWDQSSKKAIARSQHDHLANQATFSPDGRYALTSSSDYGARLWTVPELKLVAVFADHDDDVEMSVFHPTKELVATASRDHNVRIWDYSGQLLRTLSGHTADVISVEWVAGADEVLSSSDDGTIRRWSASTGDLLETLDMDGVETDTVAISSDGTIFAGNDEGQLIVVSGQDGRQTIQAHDAGIKRLVLDDRRGLLVSLSYDRRMRLWDTSGALPKDLATADLPPDVWPRSCAFAGDSTIVFATFGATYRTYDYHAGRWDDSHVPPTLGVNAAVRAPGVGVLSVGDAGIVWRDGAVLSELGSLCNFLTPANRVVFAGGQLGIVFDALTGRRLHQHRSPLNCGVTFERDGAQHVLIGAYTGEGLLFRVGPDGQVEHAGEVPLATNAVKGVAESGVLLFAVSADAGACWYDKHTLERVGYVADAHDKIANGCVGIGEGYFASVSRDLKLRIWDPSQQAQVIDTPHDHSIKCVSASTDGRFVATGSYNGRVVVYDRTRAEWCYDERPTTAGISSLAFDGDQHVFLASSYDGNVYQAKV